MIKNDLISFDFGDDGKIDVDISNNDFAAIRFTPSPDIIEKFVKTSNRKENIEDKQSTNQSEKHEI